MGILAVALCLCGSVVNGALTTNAPGRAPLTGPGGTATQFPIVVDTNGAVVSPSQFRGAYLTTQLTNGPAASNIVAAITKITNSILSVKDGANNTWYPINSNGYARLQFTGKLSNSRWRLPPRGFNSWPYMASHALMTESNVIYNIDRLVTNGFVNLGYRYFELEDYWGAPTRGGSGQLLANTNFTGQSLATVSAYLRSKGMYLWLYNELAGEVGNGLSSAGAMQVTDYAHMEQDAATLASWGCIGGKIDGGTEYRFRRWVQAWNNLGIAPFWTIAMYPPAANYGDPGTGNFPQSWVRETVSAVRPTGVGSIPGDLGSRAQLYQWIDEIAASWDKFGPSFYPELEILNIYDQEEDVETQSAMTWMFSGLAWFSGDPLYHGGKYYTNRTALYDIHWDPLAQCARVAQSNQTSLVFRKDLLQQDGPVKAFALQNRGGAPTNITCYFTNLEMPYVIGGVGSVCEITDVFGHRTAAFSSTYIDGTGATNLGVFTNSFTANVPYNQTLLYKITAYPTNIIYPTVWDTDALAFFNRASITDSTISNAVNTFVTTAKTATTAWPSGFWASFPCIYPFVGGNATAHSKNLKANAFNITWAGTLTHNSNGVTGDGSTGWGDTTFNLSTGGTYTLNSGSMLAYVGTTAPTDGGRFIGGETASPDRRANVYRSGTDLDMNGPNSATTGFSVNLSTDFRGPMGAVRSGASTVWVLHGSSLSGPATDAAAGLPNVTAGLLVRNVDGTPLNFSNANLRFAMIGAGMSAAQWTEIAAALETFETTLSRNAP